MDNQIIENHETEKFEDALEFQSPNVMRNEPSLMDAICDSNRALHLFLDNYFEEAEDLLRSWSSQSMYHALSLGVLHFVQGVMTSDPRDVDIAIEDFNNAIALCIKKRKRKTFVDSSVNVLIKNTNFNSYSEEEAHAELCYCEALMLKAALIFIRDDSIISFVKAGLNIHAAFNAFKECQDLLEYRNWTDEVSKSHFETGILMFSGASNMFFASLPTIYLRILKFVGISGSLEVAFQKLERGHALRDFLRGPFCTFLILTYKSILTYALGGGSDDTSYCRSLIEPELKCHPKGAIYLFFFGRFEVLNGNFDSAITWFNRSVSSQDRWRQLKHLCKWELSWCSMFQGNFRKALSHFSSISEESSWAKALTKYMSTVLLMACDDLTTEEQNLTDVMMAHVPALKSKLSGKSIPIEKFFCSRALRYVAEKRLFLPVEELIYVFNYFPMIGKNEEVLYDFYVRIDRELNKLKEEKTQRDKYFIEDYCWAVFLKGICLRFMNKPLMAEDCLTEVWKNEKNLKEDLHLPVWALIELGYMSNDIAEYNKSIYYFEFARNLSGNGRKKIAMRNRNQYKIHIGLTEAKKNLSNSGSV